MQKRRKAFTLAEVLITLGIIGIVASLTIPNLIAQNQNQEIIAKVKKNYSTLENARKLLSLEEGGDISSLFAWEGYIPNERITKAFSQHLKYNKYCNEGDFSGECKVFDYQNSDDYSNSITSLNNVDTSYVTYDGPNLILSDGTFVKFNYEDDSCSNNLYSGTFSKPYEHHCGSVQIDINGLRKPNMMGRDIFYFDITRDAILPKYREDYTTECSSGGEGKTCAYRVITEGAVNYTPSTTKLAS